LRLHFYNLITVLKFFFNCFFQICVNQSCVSIFPFMDSGKCPSNQNNMECSGNGVSASYNMEICQPRNPLPLINQQRMFSLQNNNVGDLMPQVCSNLNKCYCNNGWGGSDCSLVVEMTDPLSQPSGTTNPSVAAPGHVKEDFKDKMNREEKFYGKLLQNI
jgi:hypothetical protein